MSFGTDGTANSLLLLCNNQSVQNDYEEWLVSHYGWEVYHPETLKILKGNLKDFCETFNR